MEGLYVKVGKKSKGKLKMEKTYTLLLLFCLISCNQNKEKQNEELVGILPTESDYFVLVKSGVIQIDKKYLFLDFLGKPCLNIDSLVFSISVDKKNACLSMPFSLMPDEICCFHDGSMFVLQDTSLIKIANKKIEFTIPFPYKQLHIDKASESGVYVYGFYPENKSFDLYFINKSKNEITKILNDTIPINSVIGTGDITILAMDSIIYLLNDGTMQPILEADDKITSLADNETGVFYATTKNIGYMDDENGSFIFYNKGAQKLLTHRDTLYILDNDGQFSLITKTNYFKILSDTITTKQLTP